MYIFAILSFIVTVSNIVNRLDLSYNYKWILICFVSFLFIVLALKGENVSSVHRIAVYIFVWGILPLSGFTSAGLVGPSFSYTFLLLIFVSYLMHGGEEFLIFLGLSDEKAALVVAEEIQKDLKKEYIPHEASHNKPYLTVSMGIAAASTAADDPKDVIKLADDALYQSKKWGRDLITLYECRGVTRK